MSYKDDLAVKVATSNSCELVALQYEAIMENINDLKQYIIDKNSEKSFEKLDKIRDILANLISTLGQEDTQYKDNTLQLYLYMNKTLNEANINGDISAIEGILNIANSLKEAWQEVGGKLKTTSVNNKNISNAVTYGKTDINIKGSTTDFGSV